MMQLMIDPEMPHGLDVFSLVFIMGAQVVIMRHFHGVSSRKMAINMLNKRIETLRKDILGKIDEGTSPDKHRDVEIETARVKYCSIVLYDITEHSFFGYAPVYMVAPGIRYAKDDKVLNSVSRDMASAGMA